MGARGNHAARFSVYLDMSIDKESNGVPEVDFSRRTTKVNLGIVVFVGLFFAIGAALLWWLSRQS